MLHKPQLLKLASGHNYLHSILSNNSLGMSFYFVEVNYKITVSFFLKS